MPTELQSRKRSSFRPRAGGLGLEVERISLTYPPSRHRRDAGVHALADVSLHATPGELLAVVGPSGCGKSTLLELICGLRAPDAGSIRCAPAVLMPQRDLLLPWLSAVENAALAPRIAGLARRQARRRAESLFAELGLHGFEDSRPAALSGGMRQRVALMRTFLFERDLMLLDEPFGALDALTRAIMQRWLLDVWQKYRRTILFITHDVDEAIFLGDRVLVMTARPGSVKLEQAVDLPRPRRPEIVTALEFVRLKRTLLEALEEESMKAFLSNLETPVEPQA